MFEHLQPPDIDALVGRVLGETYRVGQKLGAGGMGAVFEAIHLRTGRAYAVKVLLPEVAVRRDAVERFRREAEAVGALGHANVIAIHDFVVEERLAYLVMDRLEGEDLAARLERAGPLSLFATLTLLEGMAAGLEAAHERGLIHRDLKPANVFLARQPGAPERAVLLDFGLAKSFASEGDLSRLTVSGVVMGTPQYMSPEQASGFPLDARADLYALATITYELLAGRPPFEAPSLPALFAKLATDPPTPIEVHREDLARAVSSVLTRALAKAPDDRYPTATAFFDAMRAAGGAVAPHEDPPATPMGNAAHSWPRGLPPTHATPPGVGGYARAADRPDGVAGHRSVGSDVNGHAPTMATPAGVRAHPGGSQGGSHGADAHAPTMATPAGVNAHAPTRATPAGVDAHAPTRTTAGGVGDHAGPGAYTPTAQRRPQEQARATAPSSSRALARPSMWPWIAALAAVVAFALLGGGVAIVLYWRAQTPIAAQSSEVDGPAPDVGAGPLRPESAGHPSGASDLPGVPRPDDRAPGERAPGDRESAHEGPEVPAPSRSADTVHPEPVPLADGAGSDRAGADRAGAGRAGGGRAGAGRTGPRRPRSADGTNPSPPAAPPAASPAPSSPPGAPPGAPVDGTREAIAYMERSDWQGCIRETHRHPRSARLLGTRMNCAVQAGDGAELGRTCDALRAHYPTHPYTNTCATLERVYPP